MLAWNDARITLTPRGVRASVGAQPVFLMPKGLHAIRSCSHESTHVSASLAVPAADNPTWPPRRTVPCEHRGVAPQPPCRVCEKRPADHTNGYGLCERCADFYDYLGDEMLADYYARVRATTAPTSADPMPIWEDWKQAAADVCVVYAAEEAVAFGFSGYCPPLKLADAQDAAEVCPACKQLPATPSDYLCPLCRAWDNLEESVADVRRAQEAEDECRTDIAADGY